MFKRGMSAYSHTAFYFQLGADPDEIIASALSVLARRFDLQ
jgi:hypothetical protein